MLRLFKRLLLFSTGALVGLSFAVFIFLNRSSITLDLYFFETIHIPVWYLVLQSMIIGAAIPTLLSIAAGIESLKEKSRMKERLGAMEHELKALRNLPLADVEKRPVKAIRERRLITTLPEVLAPRLVHAGLREIEAKDDDMYPVVIEEHE